MQCYSCGKEYKKLATHWTRSSTCSHPDFSQHQTEILTGILMGDGYIDDKFDENRNPRLKVIMTNKKYLQYVADQLGALCTKDPYIHQTAEQLANNIHESSYTNKGEPNNFKDQYKIQTISHPDLDQFANWYETGEKTWPDSIELTPTVLKHWYACDGSFNNNGSRFYAQIHCANERNNKKKVEELFTSVGLSPSRWRDDKQENESYKTAIIFNKEETKEFFEYIGTPLPGFEYKWP